MKRVAAGVLPKNFGVIIRTAAVNASDLDVEQDILAAVEKWRKTCQQIRKRTAPALLMGEMSRANTIIRDTLDGSFSQICVDDEAMYNEIRSYIRAVDAEKERIVKLYRGTVPIFDNFDISRQIKSLFAKYVSLKRGAYLIMESTEAMHVIDQNSGNRTKAEDNQEQTAMEVNLAAATEIARQIRLRDWGGLVIVDFIDMHKSQNRQLLYEEMQRLMASDKAKHTILPLSKFGLMQITRQRVRPAVEMNVTEVCPTCMGKGKIQTSLFFTDEVEERIEAMVAQYGRGLRLHLHPFIYAYVAKGWLSRKWQWALRYGVRVIENQSLGMLETKFYNKQGEETILASKPEDKACEKQ